MARLLLFANDWSVMDLVHPLSTCIDIFNVPFVVLILAGRWNAFGFCFLMILLTWGSSCKACKAFSSGNSFSFWTSSLSNFLWEFGAHIHNWVRASLMGPSLMCLRTHLPEKGLLVLAVYLGDTFLLNEALFLLYKA